VGLSSLSEARRGNSGRDQKQVDSEWIALHGSHFTRIANAGDSGKSAIAPN
jgi:hypothetical protein